MITSPYDLGSVSALWGSRRPTRASWPGARLRLSGPAARSSARRATASTRGPAVWDRDLRRPAGAEDARARAHGPDREGHGRAARRRRTRPSGSWPRGTASSSRPTAPTGLRLGSASRTRLVIAIAAAMGALLVALLEVLRRVGDWSALVRASRRACTLPDLCAGRSADREWRARRRAAPARSVERRSRTAARRPRCASAEPARAREQIRRKLTASHRDLATLELTLPLATVSSSRLRPGCPRPGTGGSPSRCGAPDRATRRRTAAAGQRT